MPLMMPGTQTEGPYFDGRHSKVTLCNLLDDLLADPRYDVTDDYGHD